MKTIPALFVGLLLFSLGHDVAKAQLLISEYVEGSSNNKALEVWNVSTTNVTFGTNSGQLDVKVYVYVNGSATPTAMIPLTPGHTMSSGDVFVLANSSAVFAANADQLTASVNWNGDDALVLFVAGTILDSIGQVGFDPGFEWGTGMASTADNTLRRKGSSTNGDTDVTDAYDPSTDFDGYPTDSFDDLGAPPTGVVLAIQLSNTNAILSWPASQSGYQLQSTTNLLSGGTIWSNVSQTPVISGTRQLVTNDLLAPKQFYRLTK